MLQAAPATALKMFTSKAAVSGHPNFTLLPRRRLTLAVPHSPKRVNFRSKPTPAAYPDHPLDRSGLRDVPLREKTLWRMLYETAARASEVLALDIEDLDLPGRRAKVVSALEEQRNRKSR